MKYSVHARQPSAILDKADEIFINAVDKDALVNYLVKYPNKIIVQEIFSITAFDLPYEQLAKDNPNLIFAISDLEDANYFETHNIPFFYLYPTYTWEQLTELIDLKPCAIRLAPPLTFSLDAVKSKTNIPLRITANFVPKDWVKVVREPQSFWVRPEDIPYYEKYIDTCEFRSTRLAEEAVLLDVYKKQEWPGNLRFLFTGFSTDIDNRALPEDFAEARLNCGQRCMTNGSCHICENGFWWAKMIKESRNEHTQS